MADFSLDIGYWNLSKDIISNQPGDKQTLAIAKLLFLLDLFSSLNYSSSDGSQIF